MKREKLVYESPVVGILKLEPGQVLASSTWTFEDEDMFQDDWEWDSEL